MSTVYSVTITGTVPATRFTEQDVRAWIDGNVIRPAREQGATVTATVERTEVTETPVDFTSLTDAERAAAEAAVRQARQARDI